VIISALILVLSLSLLFFYFQTLCQRILRREFDRDYFQTVVRSGALEFATLRQALESPTEPLNYEQCRVSLQCDLLTLRYLAGTAAAGLLPPVCGEHGRAALAGDERKHLDPEDD